MDTKTRISNAERLGRWVGGMWRAGVRRERRLAGWLVVTMRIVTATGGRSHHCHGRERPVSRRA